MRRRISAFAPILGVLLTAALLAACSSSAPEAPRELEQRTPTSSPDAVAATPPAAPQDAPGIKVGVVGDLMFARDITTLMQEHGAGYPFERVRPLFSGVDLFIGNLEGTFTARGTPLQKMYTFRSPPELAITLREAGFDAVSLGNNHAYDFGALGLEDTMAALRAAGTPWFGAGSDEAAARTPLILEARGQRIAFLGYSGVGESGFASADSSGVAAASTEAIEADVRVARTRADYVIAVIHAGIEYTREPSSWQAELAHAAIDAGADVVVGHHPHVLQPVERYGAGLILYSLGNFVFDLDADDLATLGKGPFETVVAVLTLSPDARPAVEFRPAFIDPVEDRPRPASAGEAADILAVLGDAAAE